MVTWARVFIRLSPRPLVTQDRCGTRKRIRVGGLRAGVRADPPHTVRFLHRIPKSTRTLNLHVAFLVIIKDISQGRRINMFYFPIC